MTIYFKNIYLQIKKFFWDDLIIRTIFIIVLVLAVADWLLWRWYLSSPDFYVYIRIGLYPVKFLATILLINTLLAFFSYEKEKEISYLLFIGNLVAVLMILALEIFYFINT